MKKLRYTTSPVYASSICECGNRELWLLQATEGVKLPNFYICWACKEIYQIGVGKVEME